MFRTKFLKDCLFFSISLYTVCLCGDEFISFWTTQILKIQVVWRNTVILIEQMEKKEAYNNYN